MNEPAVQAIAEPAQDRVGILVRTDAALPRGHQRLRLGLGVAAAVAVWVGAYSQLDTFAAWLTYDVIRLGRSTHLAGASSAMSSMRSLDR